MSVEGAKALEWMRSRIAKYSYANTQPQKLDPDRYGFSDCSGVIHRAYLDTSGIELGVMSFDQANDGREIQHGYGISQFRPELCEPGDIIAMDLTNKFGGYRFDHVEMFVGTDNGVPMSIGHGGYPPMGPNIHHLGASYLLGSARRPRFTVRRIGDSTPSQPRGEQGDKNQATILEEISMLKATHVIFHNSGKLYIANLLAGTYQHVLTPTDLANRRTVLARTGMVLKEWKDFKTNGVNEASPAAFGVEVKA